MTDDRTRYEYLYKMLKRHGINSPAGQAIWKELEEIKNRHGGLPPQPKD